MSISPWPSDQRATEDGLREQLAAEQAMNDVLLEESHSAALEIAAEDRDWRIAAHVLEHELTREGLAAIARNCTVMSIASPMIKKGIAIRTGFVWGQGVSIQARATGPTNDNPQAQDVNAIVQAFLDDPGNQAALTGAEAHVTNEHTLATKGNFLLVFFPDPVTGRVKVRTVPFEEIADKWTNPEDRTEDWYFLRTYSANVVEPGTLPNTTRMRNETRRVLHPALGYNPTQKPTSINNIPVQWDQPILHATVNRPEHTKWGVPDVYASLPWARAYEEFLTDWAKLVKALSKFAWRLTGDRASKAQRAAQRIAASMPGLPQIPGTGVDGSTAGATAAMGPGAQLEAIPKTGATIDSGSGRPLAAMAATGMGVSVIDLLADPGVTGARAVAETMDKPQMFEMGMRQRLWASVLRTVLSYVVEQAVITPQGGLHGTADRDPVTGVRTVQAAGDTDVTVEVVFPDLAEVDPVQLVTAIVQASTTETLPPVWIAKALLRALGEQDVDEVLEPFIDPETGEWIPPVSAAAASRSNAGQAAVDAARRGADAAEAWRDPAAEADPTV